jgi:hypothetical protein
MPRVLMQSASPAWVSLSPKAVVCGYWLAGSIAVDCSTIEVNVPGSTLSSVVHEGPLGEAT